MQSAFLRYRVAGMIGNILEHYDHALFALLAPFIAPLFFNNRDPLTALILTYGMIPLGIVTKPLGSLFFGWIGDQFGRKQSLFFSLIGMACVTVGMGCLPVYSEIGFWAPLFLALGRMLQNFCAAGESTGGAIYVLEHTADAKRSMMSSVYAASSMGGILIASCLVALFCSQELIAKGWRILSWLGGATAILGVFLRQKTEDGAEYIESPKRPALLQTLKENKESLLCIIAASGFSYTTYAFAFTFMNGYVPLVTTLTGTVVMNINTGLLLMDMLLLPCFGYLANRIGKEKVMLAGALCSAIGAIPLFYFLDEASLGIIIGIRMAILISGVAFAAPYHAWTLERVPPQQRFTILSLGGALGSLLIGAPTSAISLWVYQKVGWVFAPGLYLMVVALLASYVVRRSMRPVFRKVL